MRGTQQHVGWRCCTGTPPGATRPRQSPASCATAWSISDTRHCFAVPTCSLCEGKTKPHHVSHACLEVGKFHTLLPPAPTNSWLACRQSERVTNHLGFWALGCGHAQTK